MNTRIFRALIILVICALAATAAWNGVGTGASWDGWVKGWIGGQFKLVAGGTLGWAFDRYFLCNDVSAQPDPSSRALAALARAIVCGLFAAGAVMAV